MKNESTIGLSDRELSQLWDVSEEYGSRIGFKVSDPAVWFGVHVKNHLRALCGGAAASNRESQTRQWKKLQTQFNKLRQYSMQAFKSYSGRKPTADDLLQELSRFVTVPEFASKAIRRGVERLSG